MNEVVHNNHSPAYVALICQIIALGIMIPFNAIFPALTALEWILAQGVVAAVLSYFFNMAIWWIPIQACFMPAVVTTLATGLSPSWFGLGFFLLVLIYGKTYRTQVPLYLSSSEVTKALSSFLPRQKKFTFMDLGCGCGGLLSELNKTHATGLFYGIEAAPLPYLISKMKNMFRKSGCKIKWGDFWKHNLSHYDVVYAYLSPVPMQLLWKKVCREMRPGSIFISNSFMIPDVIPEDSIKLDDFSGSTLYIWRVQ